MKTLGGGSSTPSVPATGLQTGPAPAEVAEAVATMPLAQQLAAAKTTSTVSPSAVEGPLL